jgi:glycine/D-amino acid oxidase-like deaminating enzyme
MSAPAHARYVIIGAGIHGLSTAWHLAAELQARGAGSGADIVVLDKTDIGAGASGIACGTIRNNYFQPAMRALMAHNVSVWESDPDAFSYHPVGFLQAAPEAMHAGVVQVYTQQQAIGYDSVLVEGEEACQAYMLGLFPDWQAPGITTVLHEKQGGYANNRRSLEGLAAKARALGVRIQPGTRVTGLRLSGGAVAAVETDQGTIGCDQVVVAAGPWVRDFWAMLDLPGRIDVTDAAGTVHPGRPMWTYWALQEGTLEVDPGTFTTSSGGFPPVVHVDSDAPLHDDADGSLITDQMWGIYFKPDFNFGGVQGGAAPYIVDHPAAEVAIDPYGPASPEFVVGDDFTRKPSGGIGAFTPDSFPVFDTFRENAYVIADSNHGYKMIGVGALVARELLGERQPLLEPFRYSRYRTGQLHPVSKSPFPWS